PNVSGVWTMPGSSDVTITQDGPTIRVILEDWPGHERVYTGAFGEGAQAAAASLEFRAQRTEDLFPNLSQEARQRLIDSGYSFRAAMRSLSGKYLELSTFSDAVTYEASTGALSVSPARAPVKRILTRKSVPGR